MVRLLLYFSFSFSFSFELTLLNFFYYCLHSVPGKHQVATGKLICEDCLAGRASFEGGRAILCEDCDAGRHQGEKGKTECHECLNGTYAPAKSISCTQCSDGKYAAPASSSCTDCPLGRYQIAAGDVISCLYCSPGKYVPGTTTQGRVKDCLECPAGYASATSEPDDKSWTKCDDCIVGFHQSKEGQVACVSCLPGKFVNEERRLKCDFCPGGFIQPEKGKKECILVQGDSIAAAGSSVPTVVAKGWYAVNCGTTGCSKSEPCPAGRVGLDPPGRTCDACTSGKFSFEGSTSCLECEMGKYSKGTTNSASSSECKVSTSFSFFFFFYFFS